MYLPYRSGPPDARAMAGLACPERHPAWPRDPRRPLCRASGATIDDGWRLLKHDCDALASNKIV